VKGVVPPSLDAEARYLPVFLTVSSLFVPHCFCVAIAFVSCLGGVWGLQLAWCGCKLVVVSFERERRGHVASVASLLSLFCILSKRVCSSSEGFSEATSLKAIRFARDVKLTCFLNVLYPTEPHTTKVATRFARIFSRMLWSLFWTLA